MWIQGINPIICRRLVVSADNTLADLHYVIQIAFSWTDYHLHGFRIHGKEFGIPRLGGPWYSQDARRVRLLDFHFRVNERFLYEYDFTDGWEHQVRIERFIPQSRRRFIRGASAAVGQHRQRTVAARSPSRNVEMLLLGKLGNCCSRSWIVSTNVTSPLCGIGSTRSAR